MSASSSECRASRGAQYHRGALVLAAALLWINDLSVSSPACSVSCMRLASSAQRSCGAATNSMSMAALSTTFEPVLLKRVKNFSFRGCIRGPMEILLGRVPPYAARRRIARRSSVHSRR